MAGRRKTSRRPSGRGSKGRRAPGEPEWAGWSEDRILDLRFRDLGLKIEGTILARRIERLYDELSARGIRLRPHCWLGTEWFSPDGIPGIALPFYLAHSRLGRLERHHMLAVEGGTQDECMRILRHEAGHALDTAHRLHFRHDWQRTFGRSRTYPEFYAPRPFSRSFVIHLDAWYAQSHPAEDFAETFAVWLAPGDRWRRTYKGWPAMHKLEYVDTLMREIARKPAAVRSRRTIEPISQIRRTLREHYESKQGDYGTEHPEFYDFDLRRVFSDSPRHREYEAAAAFLRRYRREIRTRVAAWTGLYAFTIDQVLRQMMERCRDLDLHVHKDDEELKNDTTVMLTVQTMNYLHSGRHRVVL